MRLMYVVAGVAMIALGSAGPVWAQTAGAARRFTVEDLLRNEGLPHDAAAVRPSPDGQWLAVVLQRPRAGGALGFDTQNEVWLVPAEGGTARPLAVDEQGEGYGAPRWSPDGRRLVVQATASDGEVRLYVSHEGGAPVRLSEAGIARAIFYEADATPVGGGSSDVGSSAWIDESHLIAVLVPPGILTTPSGSFLARTQRYASTQWTEAARGVVATASAVTTPAALPESADVQPDEAADAARAASHVALARIDVVRGRVDTVAILPAPDLYAGGHAIHEAHFVLSPDHRSVAVIVRGDEPGVEQNRLGLVSLAPGSSVQWIAGLKPRRERSAFLSEVQWSPDGGRLAVRSARLDAPSSPSSDRVFIVDAATGTAHEVTAAQHVVTGEGTVLRWSGARALLVRAATTGNTAHASRVDWWRYELSEAGTLAGAPANLTARLPAAPGSLKPLESEGSFVGLAAGRLWRIDARGAAPPIALTDTADRNVALFQLNDAAALWARQTPPLLVRSERGDTKHLRSVVLTSAGVRLEPLPPPAPGAELVVYRPAQRLAVFTSGTSLDEGPIVWRTDGRSAVATTLLRLNPHLDRVARGARRLIDYVSTDGDSLRGVLLLPVGYEPGRRYPVVTWVYAGTIYRDTTNTFAGLGNVSSTSFLNLQLLTARGYAVLLPSIPLGPWGVSADPYLDIPKAVLPAVDRAIALGIADPDRLAVMGHSYGGYTTYTLVTHTSRFKAAIAMAGPANYVSQYGTFEGQERYKPRLVDGFMGWHNSVQWRLGDSPYAHLQQYIRNSPLFYADRITTPLLIMQGDLDFVPMQQGEEMYTALHVLKRPARFVRYWGEGHTFRSPANIRHMWGEILSWLDRWLDVQLP